MARAEAASASARADSIKGLAQSIANPAYRRLLTAEPALRRAVPGPHHRLPAHHRRRRRGAGARPSPPGDRRSHPRHRQCRRLRVGALRPAGQRGKGRHHAARSAGARALDPRHGVRPPHPAQQRRRHHHRDRPGRRPDRLAPDRRARRDASRSPSSAPAPACWRSRSPTATAPSRRCARWPPPAAS